MSNQLFTQIRGDYCISCYTPRSLELYDQKGNPVYFTLILDKHKEKVLLDKKLSHFKCKKCGAIFKIDWSDGDIPYPLSDLKYSGFMYDYCKNNSKE